MPAPGPITRYLSDDHRRLDALLREATADAAHIVAGPYETFRRGLLRHIGVEEKILLPAVQRARGGEPATAATRLRLDHGAIAALLVPSPTPTILATLRDILTAHNLLEEAPDGLYAECDRLIAADADGVVVRMEAYPAVTTNPHNDAPDVLPAVARALARAGYHLHDEPS
jgi:hypothetical protein